MCLSNTALNDKIWFHTLNFQIKRFKKFTSSPQIVFVHLKKQLHISNNFEQVQKQYWDESWETSYMEWSKSFYFIFIFWATFEMMLGEWVPFWIFTACLFFYISFHGNHGALKSLYLLQQLLSITIVSALLYVLSKNIFSVSGILYATSLSFDFIILYSLFIHVWILLFFSLHLCISCNIVFICIYLRSETYSWFLQKHFLLLDVLGSDEFCVMCIQADTLHSNEFYYKIHEQRFESGTKLLELFEV